MTEKENKMEQQKSLDMALSQIERQYGKGGNGLRQARHPEERIGLNRDVRIPIRVTVSAR